MLLRIRTLILCKTTLINRWWNRWGRRLVKWRCWSCKRIPRWSRRSMRQKSWLLKRIRRWIPWRKSTKKNFKKSWCRFRNLRKTFIIKIHHWRRRKMIYKHKLLSSRIFWAPKSPLINPKFKQPMTLSNWTLTRCRKSILSNRALFRKFNNKTLNWFRWKNKTKLPYLVFKTLYVK